MSNLFGSSGGKTVATQDVRANGLQVQASSYGMGLPIVYGRQRISGTLIWYGDFQAVEHDQQVGKGGGGGTNVSFTYSSSFQLALCEGPVASLGKIWQDSGLVSLPDINGTFSAGAASQSPWSHLTGTFAIGYPFTCWIGCVNLALGGSPNVPNYNFEINGLLQFGGSIVDAEPSAIVNDLMTSVTHGIGFSFLGSLGTFHDYCVANSIFLSLVVDQETTMNDVLDNLLQITNSNTAWSNGKLIIIPYGDEPATGNGVTYTPPTTVRAVLSDKDYIEPVTVDRKPLGDQYNVVRVEWVDPSNNYVTTIAEAKDEADISASSIRQDETIQAHAITNAQLAQQTAQRILQRALYIRNTYTVKTTMQYVALEPGDVIQISDSEAEIVNEPVRITDISEGDNGDLEINAEEFPAGVSEGATQSFEPAAGFSPNVNGPPDTTQPPVIFRGPQFLTDGDVEVWIGACGSGANWGGANVLVSFDNVTYTRIGSISPGCRYGTLTAALADSATDPDTLNSFSVALEGPGSLSGGTHAEADNLATLTLIDKELVAYSSTVLNGDGTYTLGNGYLRRQCYGTAHAAHAIGAPWLRVDDNFFRWKVDPSLVGTTVFIKLQAWNLYGGGLQSESSLTPVSYVVGTAAEIPDTPPVPSDFIVNPAVNGNLITWENTNPAAVAITSIEFSTDNVTWSVLGQVQGTHYTHPFSGNTNYFYRARARSPQFIWSAYTASVSTQGGSIDYAPDGLAYQRMALGTTLTGDLPYNGDFEQWADGQPVPDGWTVNFDSTGSGAAFSRSSTSFSGLFSLSIGQSGGGSSAASRPFGVQPGMRYKFGVWARSTIANPGSMFLRVLWFSSDVNLARSAAISTQDIVASGGPGVANTWTTFFGFVQAPASARFARIALYNYGGVGGIILFDRVSIAPYSDGQFLILNNTGTAAWIHVGTLILNIAGSATLVWHSGNGYNTGVNQQAIATCLIRAGNNTAAPNIAGLTVMVEGGSNPLQVGVNSAPDSVRLVATGNSTAPANTSWEVYFACGGFTSGPLEVVVSSEYGDSFAFDGSPSVPNNIANTFVGTVPAWRADHSGRISTVQGGIAPFGSVPPSVPGIGVVYTSTSSSITLSWPAFTLYRMDGTTTAVPAGGGLVVSGLSASTTYTFYPYISEATGTVQFSTAGSSSTGSPQIAYSSASADGAAQAYQQGNSSLAPFTASTPASGGSGGGGGDHFGCVCTDMWVQDGMVARDVKVGTALHVASEDLESVAHEHLPVKWLRHHQEECVRVITESGAAVRASVSTPMTLRDGTSVTLPEMLNREARVLRDGQVTWERVVSVEPIGVREVMRISLGGRVYFAGESQTAMVGTHNYSKP